MQSSNPVFTRADGFNGRANQYGNTTYPGNGQGYSGYGSSPQDWVPAAGTAGTTGGAGYTPVIDTRPMTIDSVVQKTGATLLVLVLAAGATWFLTPEISSEKAASSLYALALVGALGGFVLAMVNSFKKVISPALVLTYAAFQGVFVGAFSKAIESWVSSSTGGEGVVIPAVLGTLAAFAGTLAAYKFFNIRVGNRFRKWMFGAVCGFVALSMLDLVLSFFGASFGFNGFGTLGLITSIIGLALGVLMLILDFDFVERGIEAGLPERESWRAAFGLTVTLVWIYIEMLRILAILRGD